jgi:hypothetical protein
MTEENEVAIIAVLADGQVMGESQFQRYKKARPSLFFLFSDGCFSCFFSYHDEGRITTCLSR